MRHVSIALLSGATLALFASTASAQYYYRGPAIYDAPTPYTVYSVPARGYYCAKACTQDTSPCDPPEYKRTDSRCSSPTAGVR